jgi:hypothetical protein
LSSRCSALLGLLQLRVDLLVEVDETGVQVADVTRLPLEAKLWINCW